MSNSQTRTPDRFLSPCSMPTSRTAPTRCGSSGAPGWRAALRCPARRQAADPAALGLHYVAERRDMIRYPDFPPPEEGLANRQRPDRSDVQDHHGAFETLRHALERR